MKATQELEKKEGAVIRAAVDKGFHDPRIIGNDNRNLLWSEDANTGQKHRRYITGFRYVKNFSDVSTLSNARAITVNAQVVKDMIEDWQDGEKLDNPIMIDASVSPPEIQGGCHRHHSWFGAGKDNLPAFEVSGWYDVTTGQLLDDKTKIEVSTLKANIAGNPKSESTEYGIPDVAQQIRILYKKDKTFGGQFPRDFSLKDLEAPYSKGHRFDKIMTYIYGPVRKKWPFRHPTPVGKIMKDISDPNGVAAKEKAALIREMTEPAKTQSLERMGWESGEESEYNSETEEYEKKRVDWTEHHDASTGYKIVFGTDEGRNFFQTAFHNVLMADLHGDSLNGIMVFFHIKKPKVKLEDLRRQQVNALEKIDKYNLLLNLWGRPFMIRKVLMPKQLVEAQDKDHVYECAPGEKFVDKFNKVHNPQAQLVLDTTVKLVKGGRG